MIYYLHDEQGNVHKIRYDADGDFHAASLDSPEETPEIIFLDDLPEWINEEDLLIRITQQLRSMRKNSHYEY